MPQAKYPWEEIRKRYEDIKRTGTDKALAGEYGLEPSYLRTKASKEGWISARKLRNKARNRAQEIADKRLEKKAEKLAEKYAEELVECRVHAFEAALQGMEQFKASSPTPKDFPEAVKAMELAERALQVESNDGAVQIGVNIGLLSTPQPSQPPIDV